MAEGHTHRILEEAVRVSGQAQDLGVDFESDLVRPYVAHLGQVVTPALVVPPEWMAEPAPHGAAPAVAHRSARLGRRTGAVCAVVAVAALTAGWWAVSEESTPHADTRGRSAAVTLGPTRPSAPTASRRSNDATRATAASSVPASTLPTHAASAPPATSGMLRAQDRGPAVVRLQHLLFQQGFTYVQVTGVYDGATVRGVLQLQHDRGLSADPPGVYGPQSQAALDPDPIA